MELCACCQIPNASQIPDARMTIPRAELSNAKWPGGTGPWKSKSYHYQMKGFMCMLPDTWCEPDTWWKASVKVAIALPFYRTVAWVWDSSWQSVRGVVYNWTLLWICNDTSYIILRLESEPFPEQSCQMPSDQEEQVPENPRTIIVRRKVIYTCCQIYTWREPDTYQNCTLQKWVCQRKSDRIITVL